MLNRLRFHLGQRKNGRFSLPGLHHPVEIIRDQWGVPHIYAANEHDLFFAQGFVHAQDRLFQMDLNRRVGAGRLSEIIGPKGVATDRFARIMGWTQTAVNQVQGGDETAQAVAQAYCDGVNAFITVGKLPSEFRLLLYRPEPWQLHHSAAWGIVLAWGLSANWQSELIRDLLVQQLGTEKAAALLPQPNGRYPTILPSFSPASPQKAQLAAQLLAAYEEVVDALPLGKLPVGSHIGSNNWVVSGERMETKRPLLANDPHLPPIFPAIWYENHLVGGGYNVTGYSTPGVPGVLIGHNEQIAWGITNAFTDIQDIYIEQFHPDNPLLYQVDGVWRQAEQRQEQINIRGCQPLPLTVRYTHHGPVISDLLPGESREVALCWTYHQPNNHLRSILKLNQAADWDSFNEALGDWAFPPQNMVYADVDGNIGYVQPGQVPLRPQGNGLLPAPGWHSGYDWDGLLPAAALPRCFNPPDGMIVTANNRIVGSEYPHWLTGEWLPPYRAARLQELLAPTPPLALADHARIQQDTVSPLARRFLPLVLPQLARHDLHGDLARGYALLQAWSGEMTATSVAPTLYFGWLVHLTRVVMVQALGAELGRQLLGQTAVSQSPGNPFHAVAYELLLTWLETMPPPWVGDITPHILPSYVNSFVVLRQTVGAEWEEWQWGKLHQLKLAHPLAVIPGLGRRWRPRTVPIGGGTYTINQTAVPPQFPPPPVEMFASCRMLLDVGGWDNSLAVLPGGQSAYVNSEHYQDGMEDWLNGRYHPMLFSRTRIEAAAHHTTQLRPANKKAAQSH